MSEPRAPARHLRLAALVALTLLMGVGPVAPDPARICLRSAARAARMTGVPFATLAAIALAESGRPVAGRLRPWPWTLNLAGAGAWFATRAAARRAAEAQVKAGRDDFDVGCFQINMHWHGADFPSVGAMLDPDANALYAARFLRRLYRQTGDWAVAAGHYHSQDPRRAAAYRRRLARFRTPRPPAQAAAAPLIAARLGPPLVPGLTAPQGAMQTLGAIFAPTARDRPPLFGGQG